MEFFLYLFFIFLSFFKDIYSRERIWICNTNADDPSNWINGDYVKGCEGFYFPEQFEDICLMSLQNLTTNAIYFPTQGDIELRENAEIIFSENSDNCVQVRSDIKTRNIADPQCWKNDNKAIPDTERVPCKDDVMIIPGNISFSIKQSPFTMYAKISSVKGERMNFWGFYARYRNQDGCSEFIINNWSQFARHYFPIDDGRIYCRTDTERDFICNLRTDWRPIVCSNPVNAVGHCTGFCGTVISINTTDNFEITKFFQTLTKDHTADAYYNQIGDDPKAYQIMMTDSNQFTGESLDYAKKFYENIKSDLKSWRITGIQARFSGYPINDRVAFQNALGILFGTLFAVVLMFALLFIFYVGPLRDVNIKIPNVPSWTKSRRSSAKTRKQFVFARFDNKDDGTTSIGGSIISLDKAFDNPMYGQQMASTSSGTIMETLEEGEEIKEIPPRPKTESTFSNPMFDKETVMDLSEE